MSINYILKSLPGFLALLISALAAWFSYTAIVVTKEIQEETQNFQVTSNYIGKIDLLTTSFHNDFARLEESLLERNNLSNDVIASLKNNLRSQSLEINALKLNMAESNAKERGMIESFQSSLITTRKLMSEIKDAGELGALYPNINKLELEKDQIITSLRNKQKSPSS